MWRKEEKLDFITRLMDAPLAKTPFNILHPNAKNAWLITEYEDEFTSLIPIGIKGAKRKGVQAEAIFKTYSLGISTNRDEVIYDYDTNALNKRLIEFIEHYNIEVDRYKRAKKRADEANQTLNIDNFVDYQKIKWDGTLKGHLRKLHYSDFDKNRLRQSLYRPFCKRKLYFDRYLINSIYLQHYFFPTAEVATQNRAIILTGIGSEKPFMTLMTNLITDLHLVGAGSGSQCFPFYIYDEDGTNRRENITDWALKQFQTHYQDVTITKWDIFYYVYAVLHHPSYREKFGGILKRELPRIPQLPTFHQWATIGQQLAHLHVNYEQITPYPLDKQWRTDKPISTTIKKMRLEKHATTADVVVNESLRLTGVPMRVFDYQLGNRSALEWVIEQYQVKGDKNPNRYSEDEYYIIDLIGRVVQVSLDTQQLIEGMGEWG